MTYFNYDELSSAPQILAHNYPDLAEVMVLPNTTHESRKVQALLIGSERGVDRPTAIFVGGIHAREWVPPDALISFAADLLEAGRDGTGLRYGNAYFDATLIARILNSMQIVLVPCANPDGRVFSQQTDPSWRKNRRQMINSHGGICHGVDINRNFDVVWDFKLHFAPGSVSASDDPCDRQVYVGPSALSEPETRNIVWLLDNLPGARWFVDIHSAIPAVFHSWGIDSNQSADAAQNFLNPLFDGIRGNANDSYGEFIHEADLIVVRRLAQTMTDAVGQVDGSDYAVGPAFELYATSGASDDYAYSRHLAHPELPKVLGFTMECGKQFQPDVEERETTIKEVCAALLAFCRDADEAT